jgi:hypothetical protein
MKVLVFGNSGSGKHREIFDGFAGPKVEHCEVGAYAA